MDAFKALALGAHAVLVGRAACWALASDGAPGVHNMLTRMTAELVGAMKFAGTCTIESTSPHSLTARVA